MMPLTTGCTCRWWQWVTSTRWCSSFYLTFWWRWWKWRAYSSWNPGLITLQIEWRGGSQCLWKQLVQFFHLAIWKITQISRDTISFRGGNTCKLARGLLLQYLSIAAANADAIKLFGITLVEALLSRQHKIRAIGIKILFTSGSIQVDKLVFYLYLQKMWCGNGVSDMTSAKFGDQLFCIGQVMDISLGGGICVGWYFYEGLPIFLPQYFPKG